LDEKALNKLRRYCAYQERCHEEVRSKLLELKVYGDDLEEIISHLVAENFLNEERFAKAFAGGKFRVKQWGRIKIKNELKYRKISAYCIQKGMEEISDEDYLDALNHLFLKAKSNYAKGTPAQRHYKIRQFLIRKGYEPDLVTEIMRKHKV